MFKILLLSLLLTSTFASNIRRLQKPVPKTYTPLKVPPLNDGWKASREGWYKFEMLRLQAEQKFHTSEFKRYNRQQKWNDDRIANESNEKSTMAARVRKDLELDEQARIDIDDLNAHINFNQNSRNPANREEDRAKRIYDEENAKAWTARVEELKSVKIPEQPKPVVKRRNLQAKTDGYTAAQAGKIKSMKGLWEKRSKDLQAQIDLNLKFHAVEFEEFVLDTHRVEDVRAIMESDLALNEKRTLVWQVWGQYDQIKAPTALIINKANQDRTTAQNLVNSDENAVNAVAREQNQFNWATKA